MKPKIYAAAGLAILALVATGCEKLKARDHLNKGVQAFKGAKFPDAVEHFKSAIELDPDFPTARLYLATAYMSQYIPGAESPENVANAKAAEDQFQKVLDQDPKNTIAIASIASLHYNGASGAQGLEAKMKKLDDARVWYQKLADVDPANKEAWYSLGVITFNKYYPAIQAARAGMGMKPDDPAPLKDKKVRAEMKDKWLTQVEQGIGYMQKSLEIDPEYDDAMAYLNLLIRYKADLADTPEEAKKGVDLADSWVAKTMDTKRIKAERVAKKGANVAE